MRIIILVLGTLTVLSCNVGVSPDGARFSSDPTIAPVQPGLIDEASGIVDSRTQPGNIWVEQDSGSPAELALLGHDGQLKGKISIPNATNVDWEDLSIGPGPQSGKNYLYIADIGDNNAQRPNCVIYRLPEPASLQEAIGQVERINFKYPDGPRDAEALLVDPQTRDTWIFSKREGKIRMYRLPYPQDVNQVTTLEAYGELPFTYVTSAAISPDGTEILLRTYLQVFLLETRSRTNRCRCHAERNRSTVGRQSRTAGGSHCFRQGRQRVLYP